MTAKRFLSIAVLALAFSVGCKSGGNSGSGGASISPEAAQEARDIFSTRCQACHGPQGHGDGPASAGLNPQPRNFSDPSWQESVTDEHIERIIVVGGAGVGLSPGMPNNPDLRDKPEVVSALRTLVRGLAAN